MGMLFTHLFRHGKKAAERNIVERINRAGMQSSLGASWVPTEKVVEIKNGQKRRQNVDSSLVMCWSKWSWM
jgi:transcription antitermination factor NusG